LPRLIEKLLLMLTSGIRQEHPYLPLLSTTTRCPTGPQNRFESGDSRTELGSLFADTLQDLGKVLILQDRDDRQLHQITPHEREFGQSLGILAL
jgi:hypothetical protein